ncbi:alpha/beta hydrolase [Catenulispora rubra]|uniref:alpha/beta hydrolase n=1 Tax=Catenulispora rubra TaxID=280293 RepID=UPI0018924E53|nr:alpha/beta hydrolase [Catenulispora rubra]
MPLDPLLAPLLDVYNSLPTPAWTDAADRRRVRGGHGSAALYAGFVAAPVGVAEVWEELVPVEEPAGEITLRIYRDGPADAGARGALLHLHGGGWWSGGLGDVDRRCRVLAAGAGIVVVSVEYRLAPEHPFPTALHDVHAALRWAVENSERLGIGPDRIGVGGESAGANLAAALCLLLRDRREPAPRLQLLEIPALDLTWASPSVAAFGKGFLQTEQDLRWCVEQYLGDRDRTDPLASPLHAADLTGLPPAIITVAEYDPVADDGRRYADRLVEAGIPVSLTVYPGLVHGSQILTGLLPTARRWQDDVVTAVRAHLEERG